MVEIKHFQADQCWPSYRFVSNTVEVPQLQVLLYNGLLLLCKWAQPTWFDLTVYTFFCLTFCMSGFHWLMSVHPSIIHPPIFYTCLVHTWVAGVCWDRLTKWNTTEIQPCDTIDKCEWFVELKKTSRGQIYDTFQKLLLLLTFIVVKGQSRNYNWWPHWGVCEIAC